MADLYRIASMLLERKTYSAITTAVRCSRRDVAQVKKLLDDHGVTQRGGIPPGLFDDLVQDHRGNRSLDFDQPDYKAIADKLARDSNQSRYALWLDYQATGGAPDLKKYEYSQFCRGLAAYVKASGLSGVIEHDPGAEMYVDWAGDKIPIVDQATGEIGFNASVFVAILPYSSLLFVKAFRDQKMEPWLQAHVDALEYFGGVPQMVVPDNASTATYRPTKRSSKRVIHPRYQQLGDFYDLMIVPARPRKPKDKAGVERAVQVVYKRIFSYFAGETFYHLDGLNEAIAERLADINMVMRRPDGTTRTERFETDEAPTLRPLPADSFMQLTWKKVKVDRHWHIMCDYQYYSVPFGLIGQQLTVRMTPRLVSIYNGEQLVAEHDRIHGLRYRYSTDPAHSPDGSHDTKALSVDEVVNWAGSFGPATVTVIRQIIELNAASPARGLIQARNVLAALGRKHKSATLEPACQLVLDRGLRPNISVLKRLQTHVHTIGATPPVAQPATASHGAGGNHAPAAISESAADTDGMLIRPATHYEN